MQTVLRSSIPDASLAVFPVNGENSHQGLAGRNPALYPVREACKFTVLLGLRGQAELNRIGSRCTGKERDAESGNDYFGARYYASSMGRWLSPDFNDSDDDPEPVPYADLGDPQSLNLYGYVKNNPLRSVDDDGHDFNSSYSEGNTSGFLGQRLDGGLAFIKCATCHAPSPTITKGEQDAEAKDAAIRELLAILWFSLKATTKIGTPSNTQANAPANATTPNPEDQNKDEKKN